MIKNTIINLRIIKKIAQALNELNEEVIYVGGAVVSLYINDPAADDVRPTKDIDISLSVATFTELEKIREELIGKGFYQTAEDQIVCRFRYEDIKVDVMNTKSIGWAPANPWFEPGYACKETVNIEGENIYILPLSYFLATKFSAYIGRGANDPIMSHDFEDIVYILDNRLDLVEELKKAPQDVTPFLKEQIALILSDGNKQEAIEGNLFYETRDIRYKRIIGNLNELVKLL
jgi:predicted nucleotidyltransferase